MPRPSRAIAVALVTSVLSGSAAAAPSKPPAADKVQCVQAHDRGQSASTERRLREAREEFLACSSEKCPTIVREDCARAIAELETVMPSLVFAATGDNGDITDVRISLDGDVVAERVDGRAYEVNPGPHVVTFEHAGSRPVTMSIVAREGEKRRTVAVSFVAPKPPPTERRATATEERPRFPILALMLAGAGVGATATGVVMRLRADSDAEGYQHDCAPSCAAGVRDDLSDRVVVSNVLLGVGLGLIGVSVVAWLLQSRH
jgi:hypothetical protein